MRVIMKSLKSLFSVGLACVLTAALALAGCSKSPQDSLVGEYNGTSNSYLKINADGTCIYSEPDGTGSGMGTWLLEDNVLKIKVDNLSYTVYADISEDPDGFILKSDSSHWNDEYFKKSS